MSGTVRAAVGGVFTLLLLVALTPATAAAAEYSVAACQADQLNFSTNAFADFATRGMLIRRACDPEGPGLRGLITANVISRRAVQRGALSEVSIRAPEGTRFTTFRWAGTARRRDCRYALQLFADAADISPIPIKNVRANERCPRQGRAQIAGYRARTFNVNGATRVVQRVICVAGRGSRVCSARGSNYIQTYKAQVGIADALAPAVTILGDTPLARGEWVGGAQALNYDASDNAGVRRASAVIAGRELGTHERPCALATPSGAYGAVVPCPNGPGGITADTRSAVEGTHSLIVQATDAAGNVGASQAATVRIDNTPPARVDAGVDGGGQWRSSNDFTVSWSNSAEVDRAPIAAATFKLCPAGAGACVRGAADGADISRLPVQVPAQGEWTLSLWRRDAAGNESEAAASVPLALRYDAEAPQLAFDQQSASDPTLVSVPVIDRVSGVAGGGIEISREGSDTWQALPTQQDGSRLVARVDDAVLPPGAYALRARAVDQAGNEASTGQRVDGQPMVLTLPLRISATLDVGVARTVLVRRTVRRHGKRRHIRRPVTVLLRSSRVAFGRRVRIVGRLTNRDGEGIPDAEIQVHSISSPTPEQPVGTVRTDGAGQFTYIAAGTMNRTLRFDYAGTPLILPTTSGVELHVPAAGSLRVSRRRVLNGRAVTFRGTVSSTPIPPGGKLVALQVRLSKRWQTFRTARTDGGGRWAIRYRFKRTRGIQHYRFRASLPREAGYPFQAGRSRSLTVRVRGR